MEDGRRKRKGSMLRKENRMEFLFSMADDSGLFIGDCFDELIETSIAGGFHI